MSEPSQPSPTNLLSKLDQHSSLVHRAYDIFKSVYSTAMKPTVISSIINGEIIETDPLNIFVDDDVRFNDPTFDKKLQFCSKTLYNYQQNAIKKIRELELRGYHINKLTNEKIISNGWLLSLPIGSGKSLVFQFLSIFYRDIPCHPIIISTDGRHIPDHDQMQWKYYPYYYENCGYVEHLDISKNKLKSDTPNSVIALTGYQQRIMTVILTHMHLLEQMEHYFKTDFPLIVNGNKVKIAYPVSIDQVNVNELDILVVPATQSNVDKLVELSYEAPFMRVIIDDYTSMPNIDNFRQILASSTIFVSGSGFDRKFDDIPSSYYTLKYMPVPKISLVGQPEDTLKGIFRDSIATMKLMGSSCEFSQYEFVSMCDEMVRQMFSSTPTALYPPLRTKPLLYNYIALMFVLKYMDRIKAAIQMVEKDLNTFIPIKGSSTDETQLRKPKLDPKRVSFYTEWKNMMFDNEKAIKDGQIIAQQKKTTKQPSQKVPINKSQFQTSKNKIPESTNPLFNMLFVDPRVGSSVGSSLVQQSCFCCKKPITEHNGYGMVASCCGAFYCSHCLKSMCTHHICDKTTNEIMVDDENYYCCCCRAKNPRYYFNVNKKKDSNVFSYNLINDFFDTKDLKGHTMFDYYFYMFLNGFVPLYHEGKPLNIHNDIEQGNVIKNIFSMKSVPVLERVLPKDQLGILALSTINKTFHDLDILPRSKSIILFYGCPKYMLNRVVGYFADICKRNDPSTAIKINDKGQPKDIQPISLMALDFKDSVASLIGLHKNIVGIIQWKSPDKADEISQLVGRILRLNSFNNELYFYITIDTIAFE